MQILVISKDSFLFNSLSDLNGSASYNIILYENSKEPLEVISSVHAISPQLLILDDDMLKPNSAKIIRSIKQISKNVTIIFLTTNDCLDLGRDVSPSGIYYYGIKPLTKNEILDLINSAISKNKSITYS